LLAHSHLRGACVAGRSRKRTLAKQVVLVLDDATGKELARLSDFTSPDAIAFEGAR